MSLLTKALILAVNDAEYDTVPVPEWGGEVRIRSLTGAERTILRDRGEKAASWDAMVVAMGVVDDKNANLFTVEETALLAKKHPLVLERVAKVILEMSTMTPEARAEAEKKRKETLTNNGGSSSPEQSTPDSDSISTP